MIAKATQKQLKLLTELTSLPTAAGREAAVVAYVTRWAKRRKWVTLTADAFGNLTLRDTHTTKPRKAKAKALPPVIVTAHMDHPAFVCESTDGRDAILRFRGGVAESYFKGSAVRHWFGGALNRRGERGVVLDYQKDPTPQGLGPGPRVVARFAKPLVAQPGDVFTWDLPAASLARGTLRAPACDNLAGVAACLATLDRRHAQKPDPHAPELRVMLTRAEEVGFVGALALCTERLLPDDARIVVLEASKALPEAPIGAGPIVRVGDRLSVFDPMLTERLAQTCTHLTQAEPDFTWQRKLMDGGACEATAYLAFGHAATCLCVPLGQYHNMNQTRQRIERESIAVDDWLGMVKILADLPRHLSPEPSSSTPSLRDRLAKRFAAQRGLLD